MLDSARRRRCTSTSYPGHSAEYEPQVHVICVYVDDSWDRDAVKAVLDKLAGPVMDLPSDSYKPDVYTIAGLTSATNKKFSKEFPMSLWKPSDFYSKAELDQQKKERAARYEAAKAPVQKRTAEEEAKEAQAAGGGFEDSDEDEDEAPKAKKAKKV
jgi:hypothetical protein